MDGDGLELEEEKAEEQVDWAALAADLFEACKGNDGPAATALLEKGTPPSVAQENWTCLHWAALHGNVGLTEALVEGGAANSYLDMKEAAASQAAEEHGELESETEPRVVFTSPLHWAAFKGHSRVAWALLQAGYSTNDVDEVGNTPLHLASANSHPETVRVLLEHGARTNLRNAYQNRPLELATHRKCRTQLIESGNHTGYQLTLAEAQKVADNAFSKSDKLTGELESAIAAGSTPDSTAVRSANLSRLEDAIRAAKTLSIPPTAIQSGEAQVRRLMLEQDLSDLIDQVELERPIVTQRKYVQHVNVLSKKVTMARTCAGFSSALLDTADMLVRQSHAEYWLKMVVNKLSALESATELNLPQIDRLDKAIAKANDVHADADLIAQSDALSKRMHCEVELQRALDQVPEVRLPPPVNEEDPVDPKTWWDEEQDLGHVEETAGFPLPPESGEYVWVCSKAFASLQVAHARLGTAHQESLQGGAYEPLVELAGAALAKMKKEIRLLQEKDDEDKAAAIIVVEKAAKKLKKKGKGKKK